MPVRKSHLLGLGVLHRPKWSRVFWQAGDWIVHFCMEGRGQPLGGAFRVGPSLSVQVYTALGSTFGNWFFFLIILVIEIGAALRVGDLKNS